MTPPLLHPVDLRERGFAILVESLGWANAVRFMLEFERGRGDYTRERDAILPDWDAETLARKAVERGERKPAR